jgi:transcriptional regulator with XRE-family HTH domain
LELKAVGEAIRQRRVALGISQEALATDAGIDRSYMGGIERGEHNFALVNLLKISTSLHALPSELLASAGL